jgi:hypothetical protein
MNKVEMDNLTLAIARLVKFRDGIKEIVRDADISESCSQYSTALSYIEGLCDGIQTAIDILHNKEIEELSVQLREVEEMLVEEVNFMNSIVVEAGKLTGVK